jgi:hypothetical protein
VAVLAVLPAAGQDGLGRGDALDANLQVGSGGRNEPAPFADYGLGNLLVTGDVPAGRGFRGAVGYRAAGDFAGGLGSDDLFQFRSGSALSAPGLLGSGVDWLHGGLPGGPVYRRSAAWPGVAPPGSPGAGRSEPGLDRVLADPAGWLADRAEPEIVGTTLMRSGERHLVDASPLRGVNLVPAQDERPWLSGLSTFDLMRAREDEAAGIKVLPSQTPFKFEPTVAVTALVPGMQSGPLDPGAVTGRIESVQGTDYERIVQRLVQRYASSGDVLLSVDKAIVDRMGEEYRQLRDKLVGATTPVAVDAGPTVPTPGAIPSPGAAPAPGAAPGASPPDPATAPSPESPIGRALLHGETVERLASEDRGRFNELLRSAEERLREGEYMLAERRFVRALRFVPGHPLATAGLAHAQLGAGLHASAAYTLRALFSRQPEMIDTRYDPALLPARPRLLEVVERLRNGPQITEVPGGSGFLIAYAGHQLGDRSLVEEGLDRMSDTAPADPLSQTLRSLWLRREPQK